MKNASIKLVALGNLFLSKIVNLFFYFQKVVPTFAFQLHE